MKSKVGLLGLLSSPKSDEHQDLGAAEDMKVVDKVDNLKLYLPLPNLDEMGIIRTLLWNDPADSKSYMSQTLMRELIDKYGCISRTVFEFGNNKEKLESIDNKFNVVEDVERMLNMVGGAIINLDIASGSFSHMLPCQTGGFEAEDTVIADSILIQDTRDKGKRTAVEAGFPEIGLSTTENIQNLKAAYTKIIYVWASDYIRDRAFQVFLTLTADRMMQIVLNHIKSPASFRGLLMEPFVHKLFTASGVIGRMRNLETGKDVGTVMLDPWKTKNIYENHSQIDPQEGVYNVPLKSNEPAIDSLVPF